MPNKAKTVFFKWLLALLVFSLCHGEAPAAEFQGGNTGETSRIRVITDMAGRKVAVPCKISRIAAIGAVPVINGYLFALGEGGKIVNGLPYFARKKRWRLQTAIAPHLARQPMLQAQDRQINVEVLFRLRPDIVITMDPNTIRVLENSGNRIPVIFLEWRDTRDIEANMRILGRVLDRSPRSVDYLNYFETTLSGVRRLLKEIPKRSRPKVLFFDPNTLTTPLLIADWWIGEAGGQSVTAGIKRSGNIGYSQEQILQWNPDVMIVAAPAQIKRVYGDKKLSMVKAVQNRRVYAIPTGVHSWGQRTVEQPLTVLWAAKLFHPEKFRSTDLVAETRKFYRRFFGYRLTDKEAVEMINGGPDS